jgi:membrane associated rhomboid family serine protease
VISRNPPCYFFGVYTSHCCWKGRLQTFPIASSLEIADIVEISHDAELAANIEWNKGTGLESSRRVTQFLLFIVGVLGVVLYFMTPVERARFLAVLLAALRQAKACVTLEGLQGDPFLDALRSRTPRVIATPALIVLSTIIFVQSHVLGLFISAVCLWQIGLILERLVGRMAFTTVYVAAGVAAGIGSLSATPSGMSVGASGSVLGLYGLLLVTSIWGSIHRSSLTIPLNVTKQLAPVAAVFVLYKLATTGLGNVAELAALVCGLVGGIVIARDVHERIPRIRPLATAMATIVTVVGLYAVTVLHRPPNDTVDIHSEIDRVIAVEGRTAELYEKEVERFRKGRSTVAALTEVIEEGIVPELRVAALRLRALHDVPLEHQRLIVAAERFLKLRDESWRLRAAALHTSDLPGLRKADIKEQASREAFHQLTIPLPDDSSRQPSS